MVSLQNPPAIPTLLVAWIVARLRCARLVIDWHNFGYTLLGAYSRVVLMSDNRWRHRDPLTSGHHPGMTYGARHPLVRVSRWYERTLGRRADASLCVTRAMSEHLRSTWGIE